MGHTLNIFIDVVVDDGKMANFQQQFWRILLFFFCEEKVARSLKAPTFPFVPVQKA